MIKFFINRPIFATVLALLMVVAGLVTLHILPITQYPDITPPTVQVSANYPGADAVTVAQTVGLPIEQQVNGVEGMLYMSSNSSSSGAYGLTITFAVGTDIDMAAVMVQNRVSAAQGSLPQAVIQQGIVTKKQSSNIVLMLNLSSQNPIYDQLYLSNYASLNLSDELARLPGVGSVGVMGAGNYSMRVWLDPNAMRIRDITPAIVFQAISQQNKEVSAGYVGQAIQEGNNPYQYSLSVKGRLTSPEEFGKIIIKSEGNGQFLRLKDIAKIELGSVSYGETSFLKGVPCAAIAIYQLPGSNSLDVANVVKAKMKELSYYLPAGVNYDVTLDTTAAITASIDEVMRTLFETTLLVIFVIWIFLQNFRAVIIPCITIPVSLIGTLAVMAALNFSINTLTLFGLILAIAIVVDDAIVVVENATRLIQTGKYTIKDAVYEAMEELVGPIIGILLVLLAVFIPTIFISGITGQLYKQFALTISAATLISAINSLTLTPTLCALFLRYDKPSNFFIYKYFNKGYNKFQIWYDDITKWLLTHQKFGIVSYIILTVLAGWIFVKWPTTFIPTEDDGYFLVSTQLPPAASLFRTEASSKQIDKILNSYPEIKTYIGINGFSVMGGGQASNGGTYFVILKNWKERKGKGHTATDVVNRFNRDASVIQDATVFAMVPPAIPGLGATGGLQLELEDRQNLGPTELQNAIETLLQTYNTKPEVLAMSSMYQANVPKYTLKIDRDKVEMLGLNLSDVFSTLSYYMGGAYVNDYIQFGHIYQVNISASDNAQKVITDINHLSVANSNNEMVPFTAFTELDEQMGQDQITRYNMYNAASITCIQNPAFSSGQALVAVEQLVKEQLGTNFGYDWTSVAYQESQSGSSTMIIFIMAILVAYMVLAAQYESWTSPVAAMMGIPLALLGAFVGCMIMGLPISVYTQIGIILLIALSAKNAILIVEFSMDYHANGNSIRASALEGGHVRLRPILMTSFAFILGVLPMMFATGAGANSRISLGTAVVFGMLANTLIATWYVPSAYEWLQTFQEKYLSKLNPARSIKEPPGITATPATEKENESDKPVDV